MRHPPIEQWVESITEMNQAVPETAQFCRWLAFTLRNHSNPRFRYDCAYRAATIQRPQMQAALAQCAATRRDRKIHQIVLDALKDPHPNVRFWACYAAGRMQIRKSKHLLLRLLEDQGLGEIGWTVAYEAGEALKVLDGGDGWTKDRPMFAAYPDAWSDPTEGESGGAQEIEPGEKKSP